MLGYCLSNDLNHLVMKSLLWLKPKEKR